MNPLSHLRISLSLRDCILYSGMHICSVVGGAAFGKRVKMQQNLLKTLHICIDFAVLCSNL
jgi:hypothetical protein